MAFRRDITADRARQLLNYDRKSGRLIWKSRTPKMFEGKKRPADVLCRIWNSKHAGKIAGGTSGRYLTIAIDGVRYLQHRIVWLITKGKWPTYHIDHRNGAGNQNISKNLREACGSQNHQNTTLRKDSTSGTTGVSWRESSLKWIAYIGINGRQIYLGQFDNFGEAVTARLAAKRKYHPFQPVPRDA